MITDSRVDIDAPAPLVWEVFSDVERWPDWTESVTRLVALDGPGLAVGKRFEISQPGLPTLVWEVTDLDPGHSWTWVQRSPGSTAVARHHVVPSGPGATTARQQLEQRGPVGAVVGRLLRGLTRRHLAREATGLKARSEQLHRLDAAAS